MVAERSDRLSSTRSSANSASPWRSSSASARARLRDGQDPAGGGEHVASAIKPGAHRLTIYPVGDDRMPVAFEATTSGWQTTAAEKTRTGIQSFTITRTSDPRTFGYELVDTKTSLLPADYSSVQLDLEPTASRSPRRARRSSPGAQGLAPWRTRRTHSSKRPETRITSLTPGPAG